MNSLRKFLGCAALALCAIPAPAGFRVQYFVGYGIYPYGAQDTTTTTPGTGLMWGPYHTLIQLVWAGPNTFPDYYDQSNLSGGYAGGDDVVLESRLVKAHFPGHLAGYSGYDEWLYTALLPPPYTTTNSLRKPIFLRVFEDASPAYPDWYLDTSPVYPEEQDISAPLRIPFAAILTFETGNETVPTHGVTLNVGPPIEPGPLPDPETLPSIYIEQTVYNPETHATPFLVPTGYTLTGIYGADSLLSDGSWDWQLLTEGSDYTVDSGNVTLISSGEDKPVLRVVLFRMVYQP